MTPPPPQFWLDNPSSTLVHSNFSAWKSDTPTSTLVYLTTYHDKDPGHGKDNEGGSWAVPIPKKVFFSLYSCIILIMLLLQTLMIETLDSTRRPLLITFCSPPPDFNKTTPPSPRPFLLSTIQFQRDNPPCHLFLPYHSIQQGGPRSPFAPGLPTTQFDKTTLVPLLPLGYHSISTRRPTTGACHRFDNSHG